MITGIQNPVNTASMEETKADILDILRRDPSNGCPTSYMVFVLRKSKAFILKACDELKTEGKIKLWNLQGQNRWILL